MVTKTYIKPTYLPTYVTVVTIVTVVTVVTVVKVVTVVTKVTFFFFQQTKFFNNKKFTQEKLHKMHLRQPFAILQCLSLKSCVQLLYHLIFTKG